MTLPDTFDAALSRRTLLRGSALLGAGAALSGLPLGRALAAEPGIEAQWPTITALVEKYVKARKVSGMVAALGWGDAAPGFIRRGLEGFDDRDPDGPDSLFRAYSQTKPVTGMAAMILVDEGKLKLDQPLADFVPEFARMQVAIDPVKSLAALPTDRLITIRHLLTHTSGLGYAVVGKNKVADELSRLGCNPGQITRRRIPGVSDFPKTVGPDEFLKRAATVPLVAEPGARWRYSMGLDVLGLVIERITGKGLGVFCEERIFAPAGMTSSFFQVPGKDVSRLTTNYGFLFGAPIAIDRPRNSVYLDPPPFAFGGSGLVTSPADYDRFLTMIVNGGVVNGTRVMSEPAVRMGTSNLLPEGADLSGTWVAGNLFGAGGIVGQGQNEGFFGWSGAAGTAGFANTRIKLRSGLYVQYMPQDHLPIAKEFPLAIAADLAARAKAPA